MIWLASYPRSGNTFFRNILYEVYGIESSEYHLGKKKKVEENWDQFQVVKTHLLPSQLPIEYQKLKAIYIIRDGRDASISLAHHKINIKKKNVSFTRGLLEILIGKGNQYDTTWSGHVRAWQEMDPILIKFEDLISHPIREVEKLRAFIDLPTPNVDHIPSLDSQKKGQVRYGAQRHINSPQEIKDESFKHFFRKGKVGSHKEEMPRWITLLFFLLNRTTMNKFYPAIEKKI